jgi:hypothetical protein
MFLTIILRTMAGVRGQGIYLNYIAFMENMPNWHKVITIRGAFFE